MKNNSLILIIFLVVSYKTTLSQKNKTNKGVEEDNVYTVVEIMPSFPGGEDSLYSFLEENLNYPLEAKQKGIQGRVYVQFIVTKNGKINSINTVKGIGHGCDEESNRVIKKMPDWIPGIQNGKKVNVKFTLPIKFELKESYIEKSLPKIKGKFDSQIKSEYIEYMEATNKKDYEKMMETVPDKMLEIIPRTYLLDGLKQSLESLPFEFSIVEANFQYISDTTLNNNSKYQLYEIRQKSFYKLYDTSNTAINSAKNNLKKLFGDQVTYDHINKMFTYKELNNSIFIKHEHNGNWKMIGLSKAYDGLYKEIIPKPVHLKFIRASLSSIRKCNL